MDKDLSSSPYSKDLKYNKFSGLNNCHDFLNNKEEENDINITEYGQYLKRFPLKYIIKEDLKSDLKSDLKILQMSNNVLIILQKIKNKTDPYIPVIIKNQNEEIISKDKIIMEEIKVQYVVFLKDHANNIIDKVEINDENPLFFEVKEKEFICAIICDKNNMNLRFFNIKTNQLINRDKKKINMKIFSILQISENLYIFSSDKGTILYEGSMSDITIEKLEKRKIISEKTFKKGVNVNERFSFFVYNDEQQGYIYVYDSEKNKLIIKPIKYYLIPETLTVINCDENGISNKLILCACKSNNNDYRVLPISVRQKAYQIHENCFDIEDIGINFNIQFICTFINIIKENNNNKYIFNINNNTLDNTKDIINNINNSIKMIDNKDIIIVGNYKGSIEIRVYNGSSNHPIMHQLLAQ